MHSNFDIITDQHNNQYISLKRLARVMGLNYNSLLQKIHQGFLKNKLKQLSGRKYVRIQDIPDKYLDSIDLD